VHDIDENGDPNTKSTSLGFDGSKLLELTIDQDDPTATLVWVTS